MNRVARVALVVFAGLTPALAAAQEPRFLYPEPPAGSVRITRDVAIGVPGLAIDVYRPAGNTPAPALIVFTVSPPGASQRGESYNAGWARTAAAKGLVGIVPELRSDSAAQDFRAVLAHVTTHAADYGIDPHAIAVWAGSGNVSTAFPIVEDPAMTAVKAAVMFYGAGNVPEFRRDLPVLYVRAGLDRPGVNTSIATLAARALSQNAPVTVLNHSTGHHGFEIWDDDAATRDVIDRTIEFVKHATAPSYQAAMRAMVGEATAAGHVSTGNFAAAAAVYRDLVRSAPNDSRMRLAYGEALLGDAKYAEACAEFQQLKGKGLGPRDLGLPAARACAQNGDHDEAMMWLKSIPSRFLPPSVENEPAFAPLKARADVRALFQSPR